jgi:hypothetical protein
MGREAGLHVKLLAHLASLALCGWAIGQLLDARAAMNIAVWLVGAVLLHDAILWPLYTTLDRVAQRTGPLVNHIRVPVALSGLMLLAAFPAILSLREQNYTRVSGVEWDGHLERWLLVSGLLFAGSAVAAAVRRPSAAPRHAPS